MVVDLICIDCIPNIKEIDAKREELLKRIGARIFVLPSGATLDENIRTPSGTIVYAKLLMGGVRSYRLLGKKQRRTGEEEAKD